jgi:hypothetical protein
MSVTFSSNRASNCPSQRGMPSDLSPMAATMRAGVGSTTPPLVAWFCGVAVAACISRIC